MTSSSVSHDQCPVMSTRLFLCTRNVACAGKLPMPHGPPPASMAQYHALLARASTHDSPTGERAVDMSGVSLPALTPSYAPMGHVMLHAGIHSVDATVSLPTLRTALCAVQEVLSISQPVTSVDTRGVSGIVEGNDGDAVSSVCPPALHLSLTKVHVGLSVGPTSNPSYGDGGASVDVVLGGVRVAVVPGRGGHTKAAVAWPFASLEPESLGPGSLGPAIGHVAGTPAVHISCRCKDLPTSVASLVAHHASLGLVKASSRLSRRRRHRSVGA